MRSCELELVRRRGRRGTAGQRTTSLFRLFRSHTLLFTIFTARRRRRRRRRRPGFPLLLLSTLDLSPTLGFAPAAATDLADLAVGLGGCRWVVGICVLVCVLDFH